MATIMQSGHFDKLRKAIDPDNKWFDDVELTNIIRVSGCILEKAVAKCFIGIQQKAKKKHDSASVVWARNMLNRYEAGFFKI